MSLGEKLQIPHFVRDDKGESWDDKGESLRVRGGSWSAHYSSASGSMEIFFSPLARFSQYFFTQAS